MSKASEESCATVPSEVGQKSAQRQDGDMSVGIAVGRQFQPQFVQEAGERVRYISYESKMADCGFHNPSSRRSPPQRLHF